MSGDASHRSAKGDAPHCNLCAHLATSWDARFPYACRSYGFKSRAMPCEEVLRLDGEPCQGFAAKSERVSEKRRSR